MRPELPPATRLPVALPRPVYVVVSRRSRGVSIGVDLNPDASCNFRCVYCQVDRTTAPQGATLDLSVLASELRNTLERWPTIFDSPPLNQTPAPLRHLRDIAFAGCGEPTASPAFPAAARIVAAARDALAPHARIVTLTDACFLHRPAVAETLAFLDAHGGEIWAKLDAGTEAYFQRVNRPGGSATLDSVVANITAAARVRPVVIQSLFMCLAGEAPPPEEIAAYTDRLRDILHHGGRIDRVQVYTVARKPAEPSVAPLARDRLDAIAAGLRGIGARAEVFE